MNAQQKLEQLCRELEQEGRTPSLLLHACCGPCSSAVLERLTDHFRVTVLFYNPNISPAEEYRKRAEELKRLLCEIRPRHPVKYLEGEYHPEEFFDLAKGMEELPEGGERCARCYAQRLGETARIAEKYGFDYFTTTLSVSPYKNAEKLNTIGNELGKKYDTQYLEADFKKKNGYLRSVQLSKEYGLYRQNYCGCVFSKRQAEQKEMERQHLHGKSE